MTHSNLKVFKMNNISTDRHRNKYKYVPFNFSYQLLIEISMKYIRPWQCLQSKLTCFLRVDTKSLEFAGKNAKLWKQRSHHKSLTTERFLFWFSHLCLFLMVKSFTIHSVLVFYADIIPSKNLGINIAFGIRCVSVLICLRLANFLPWRLLSVCTE